MGRNVLPDAQFETGLCLVRRTPGLAGGEPHLRRDWHIIGRLDDGTPFLLDYNQAVTNWTCAVNLGDSLRKKILGKLREELRRPATFPDYIVVHDLTAFDGENVDLGASKAAAMAAAAPAPTMMRRSLRRRLKKRPPRDDSPAPIWV